MIIFLKPSAAFSKTLIYWRLKGVGATVHGNWCWWGIVHFKQISYAAHVRVAPYGLTLGKTEPKTHPSADVLANKFNK